MTSSFNPDTGAPSGGQHPVLKARWHMVSWTAETNTYNAGLESETTRTSIRFKFDGPIEALALRDPYPFPMADIVIPYTDPSRSRGGTRWDVWTASGRRLLGGPFSLDSLVDKWQTWEQVTTPLRGVLTEDDGATPKIGPDGRQIWGEIPTPCWQIIEVEGVAGGIAGVPAGSGSAPAEAAPDIFQYMAEIAEGLEENAFHQKLISDRRITSNDDVVDQITRRVLVPNLISMNKISRDEQGVLHKA